MSDRFAMPGFQQPGSPKDDERLFVDSAGNFCLELRTAVPILEDMPDFRIVFTRGFWESQPCILELGSENVIEENIGNGQKRYVLDVKASDYNFLPGNYALLVFEGNETTPFLKRSLHVEDGPLRQS